MEIEFEWDEEKRLINIEKHGIDFRQVYAAFDVRPSLTTVDPRHFELRYVTVTIVMTEFMTIVWTPRNGRIRIISARSSSRAERRAYRDLYGDGA